MSDVDPIAVLRDTIDRAPFHTHDEARAALAQVEALVEAAHRADELLVDLGAYSFLTRQDFVRALAPFPRKEQA